jgi:hypothetical protein
MLVSADRFATGMTCFAISQILLGMGLALMHWVTR